MFSGQCTVQGLVSQLPQLIVPLSLFVQVTHTAKLEGLKAAVAQAAQQGRKVCFCNDCRRHPHNTSLLPPFGPDRVPKFLVRKTANKHLHDHTKWPAGTQRLHWMPAPEWYKKAYAVAAEADKADAVHAASTPAAATTTPGDHLGAPVLGADTHDVALVSMAMTFSI